MQRQASNDANSSSATLQKPKKKTIQKTRRPKSSTSPFDRPVQSLPTTGVFGVNGEPDFCAVRNPEHVKANQLEGLNRQPITTGPRTGCAHPATPALDIPGPVGHYVSSLPRDPYIIQGHHDSLHIISSPTPSHQPSTLPATASPQAVTGAVESQSPFLLNSPSTHVLSAFPVPPEIVPSSSTRNPMDTSFQTQGGRTQKLEKDLQMRTNSLDTSAGETVSQGLPVPMFQPDSPVVFGGSRSGISAAYMKGDYTIYSPQGTGRYPNLGIQGQQPVQRRPVPSARNTLAGHFLQQVPQPVMFYSVVGRTSTPERSPPPMQLPLSMTPQTILPMPPSTRPNTSTCRCSQVDMDATGFHHRCSSFSGVVYQPPSASDSLRTASSTTAVPTPLTRAEELSKQVQQAARETWISWLERLDQIPRTSENMRPLRETMDRIQNSIQGLQVPFTRESMTLLADLVYWIQTTEGEEAVHILEEQLRIYAGNNEEFIIKIVKKIRTELELGKRFLGVVLETPVTTGSKPAFLSPPTLPKNCLLVLRKVDPNIGVTQRKMPALGGLILRCGGIDCSYCSKTTEGETKYWRTKQDALEHLSSCLLEGKTPWKCPACPHYIKTKENLYRHMETRHYLPRRSRSRREPARSPVPRDTFLPSCHTPASLAQPAPTVAQHHQQLEEQTPGGCPRTHRQNSIPSSSPLIRTVQIRDIDASRVVVGGQTGGLEGGGGLSGWPLSPQIQRHPLDYAHPPQDIAGWDHNLGASVFWNQNPSPLLTMFNVPAQSTDQPAPPLPPSGPLPATTTGSYDTLPMQASAVPNLTPASPTQVVVNGLFNYDPFRVRLKTKRPISKQNQVLLVEAGASLLYGPGFRECLLWSPPIKNIVTSLETVLHAPLSQFASDSNSYMSPSNTASTTYLPSHCSSVPVRTAWEVSFTVE
ncbi:1262_t:CDS:2 [Acaulospora colombiana]|uniref:1262_t:CDS:1 n=1 Tax=Acaulospora colombiana TaxID=27376 RepID=A0ACA9MSD6_9GLOM|nr:1262_t:CDS:2 [Acaulospora colombiana]